MIGENYFEYCKASSGRFYLATGVVQKSISAVEDINKNVVATSYAAENKARWDRAATNLNVIAIEQSPNSIPYTEFDYQMPLALILGHETEGVSKEGLALADSVVEIPMFGVNKSLNVMVSLAIVLWHIMDQHVNTKIKGGE